MELVLIKNSQFDWGEDPKYNQFYASPQQLWAATDLFLTDLSANIIASVSDGNSNHYMNPESTTGDSLIYLDSSTDQDLFMENNNELGICAKRLDKTHFQITRREYESIVISIMVANTGFWQLSESKIQQSDSESDLFSKGFGVGPPHLADEILQLTLQHMKNDRGIVILGDGMNVQFLRPVSAVSSEYLLEDILSQTTRQVDRKEFCEEVFGVATSLTPMRFG